MLAPDFHHRVVPKVVLGFLQILQISWGVSECVVSTPLGSVSLSQTCSCSASVGKQQDGGNITRDGVSALLDRLFDPSPEQGLQLSPCERLEASLHPFSLSKQLSRCFLVPKCFTLVRDPPGWQPQGDCHCLIPWSIWVGGRVRIALDLVFILPERAWPHCPSAWWHQVRAEPFS